MKAGDALGSYVVLREIGSGGMGSVYLAEHTALGRRAAIKVLQPELTSNQQMLTRFFNEARAASAIKSPGIVEIYDFGHSPDGSAYIVMELLDGESLAARLARLGKLPLGNALVIARQIASALAPAHRAAIVHRDLKPDNVFLVPDAEVAGGERVKLLDFGIAKLLGDDERGGGGLTTARALMGTPHYMSPEQCRGAGGVDARTDLYALGCILFELLTGGPPFTGEGAGDLIAAHIYLPPPKLGDVSPGLPVEAEQLIQRLLAKAASQRPQSAEEVAQLASAIQMQVRLESSHDSLAPMAGVSRVFRAISPKTNAAVKVAIAIALLSLAAVGIFAAVRGVGGKATELAQSPQSETPVALEPDRGADIDGTTLRAQKTSDRERRAPARDIRHIRDIRDIRDIRESRDIAVHDEDFDKSLARAETAFAGGKWGAADIAIRKVLADFDDELKRPENATKLSLLRLKLARALYEKGKVDGAKTLLRSVERGDIPSRDALDEYLLLDAMTSESDDLLKARAALLRLIKSDKTKKEAIEHLRSVNRKLNLEEDDTNPDVRLR